MTRKRRVERSINRTPSRASAQLRDVYAFELESRTSANAITDEQVLSLLDLAHRILLVQSALVQHRQGEQTTASDPRTAAARSRLDRAIADALEGVAERVEGLPGGGPADLREALAALKAVGAAIPGAYSDGDIALYEVLVDRIEALQQLATA